MKNYRFLSFVTMPQGYHKHRRSIQKGKFDLSDASRVKHTPVGVWDLYEQVQPEFARVPGSSRFESYLEMVSSFPYVWRMIKDIGSIRTCWFLLAIYFGIEAIASLLPAVALW
jgi:hypothetical protein